LTFYSIRLSYMVTMFYKKKKGTFIYITKQADLLIDLHLGSSPYSPNAPKLFLMVCLCPII